MRSLRSISHCALGFASALCICLPGCAPQYTDAFFGGGSSTRSTSNVFTSGTNSAFTGVLIQGGTFIEGQGVTTVTYRTTDMTRAPYLIDFNGDGRCDPVVGYQQDGKGVIQILLSYGDPGTTQFASLTLDGGENDWPDLHDLAVGDIDGDGNLDIVAATGDGLVYLHHPSNGQHTHVLAEWGAATGAQELISGTADAISDDELTSIIATALDTTKVNPTNYTAVVKQYYTSLEIGDFDNNRANDIAATRRVEVSLKPKKDTDLDEIDLAFGSVQLLLNPGGATTGEGWTGIAVGQHERHRTFDRQGAAALRAVDMDGDGDLDLVTTAADDQNVQVAWFENPGGPGTIDPVANWTQYRIGSLRGATRFDIADVTGDGRPDVIAISPTQKQMVLFVQPEEGPSRGYDWYSTPIVTFESYEPRDVKILDIDNDGELEVVVAGTNGAVRYFKRGTSVIGTWTPHNVVTFDPAGDVGVLGYGDFDGDGDIDLAAVVGSSDDTTANRVTWIRNGLLP